MRLSRSSRWVASPVHRHVGQQIEGTPGLRRIDHRRGIIRVAEPDAHANAGRNGRIICCGYRKIAGMRELAALQSGIDQIVAKDISGDNHGHHIARPGRQKAYAVKACLVILAEAIEFRRRVHCGDASVPPPCSLTFYRGQLDKLLIRQNIRCVIPGTPPAKFEIDVSAGVDDRCGTHPGRKLAGGCLLAIAKLVDDENPAVRRRPVQAGRVSGLLGERTVRIARYLYAELVVKPVGTIDLDVDRRFRPGPGAEASRDRNLSARSKDAGRQIACQKRPPIFDDIGQISNLQFHLPVQEGLIIAECREA